MTFLKRLLGVLSPVHMAYYTLTRRGEKVGYDQLGNVYYRGQNHPGHNRERRWVVYKGVPEASRVSPEWHGWLHYQSDVIPVEGEKSFRRPWQKPHRENMTGTNQAYRPPGHILKGGQRPKATGDYTAWQPPK